MIPDGVDVFYRYVVSMFVPPNPYEAASADDKIVVRRWETSLKPRKIACHGKNICDGNVMLQQENDFILSENSNLLYYDQLQIVAMESTKLDLD